MKSHQISVFCIADYFLPGFRGGGPITTLVNMRTQIAGHITLSIFTRDRDLGSDIPYRGIKTDQWFDTQDGLIYYASPTAFGPRGLRRALMVRDFDIIYLNSFFSPRSSIFPYLTLRRLELKRRILIAPRGEFSQGALAIKKYKKKAYLALTRLLNLYHDVYWHASTQMEAQDILQLFPDAVNRIHIAPDPIIVALPKTIPLPKKKKVGCLRLAFISRISPMKNLEGLLRILATVQRPVELDIYGPIEDAAYWEKCKRLIVAIPDHIRITSNGPLSPHDVSHTFAQYDLFAFPTLGENFGHVVFEALRAGTPVLISDQTPWRSDRHGAIVSIPLQDQDGWRRAIHVAAERTPEQQRRIRSAAIAYASHYANEAGSLQANLEMFHKILQS